MKYEAVIGIETHVQLKTKTKLFSAVGNDARDAKPNTLASVICMGFPGTLPYLNQAAVDLAIKAGHALNAEIATFSKFDRKHYFYPDLPKGYQITQYDQPIIGKGHVDINGKKIGITRAHLEEDAGKSTHPKGSDYSLVDFNRAGTPLLEIVSEPDISSAAEAKAYAREIYLLMKYADVSDVDLYHGNMRFDVNISLRKPGEDLGIRSEVKNLNSFRSVERATEYEIKRQTEILDKGEQVVQETRGWDENKGKTVSQRGKEHAHDYRYFPEPDLPPIHFTKEYISKIKKDLPIMPGELRAKFSKAGLAEDQIEIILSNSSFVGLMTEAIEARLSSKHIKKIGHYLVGEVMAWMENEEQDIPLGLEQLKQLLDMTDQGSLSATAAKQVLVKMLDGHGDAETIAKAENLMQIRQTDELDKIVEEVIAKHPNVVEDIKAGQEKAIGFLVGQAMSLSQGRADPKKLQQLIAKKIGE